ncbi:hypothetical protein [uncultured Salinibacterium sp.]|uniref:hypothetical protein n=1 Tax=uncultured Salinibacterium sp. TaxID=459274 RepID=UPI0030D77462|tara:strand:+ start:247 stop:630 length:384 start_codon:yes stop_codon:yes gene_type:complete
MSAFYEGLAGTAQRLIADKGASVTLRRGTATVDPITGEATSASDTYTMDVVQFPFRGGANKYPETWVQEARKGRMSKFLASANSVEIVPLTGDTVTDVLGVEWRLLGTEDLNPDGTKIIYTLFGSKV